MKGMITDARTFSDAMNKVSKVLKKSPIPILEEIRVTVKDGICTLTGTDLETWLTTQIPVQGDDLDFVFNKTKDVMKAISHFDGELTMELSEQPEKSKEPQKLRLCCSQRMAEYEVNSANDYPELVKVEDAEYQNFPIPRLVFGLRMLDTGKVVDCTLGVVADERPCESTQMYHYPFSNVYTDSRVCTGNNVLPRYKKRSAIRNFPRYLLGLPDNDDMFDASHNRKGLSHKELLEHLKDKDPAYYYTDILIPNGHTLGEFISFRR